MTLTRRTASLVLAGALALSACGGTDDDAGAGATPDATTEAAPTTEAEPAEPAPTEDGGDEAAAGQVDVSAIDFGYELSATELAAGEVTIDLTNDGQASHNVVVEKDGEDVGGTDVIGPGETASVTVDLEPGEYIFYCSVGNHRAMGMEIPVTVV